MFTQEEWRGEVIHLSWSPRAFLLRGFLSDEECDHLVAQVGVRLIMHSLPTSRVLFFLVLHTPRANYLCKLPW